MITGGNATSSEQPVYHASAPGRVNLLGEHVDYNQGVVLPAAIDRRVNVRARLLPDAVLRLHALDLDAEVTIALDQLQSKTDADGRPLPGWALYPAGVAWALQRRGLQPPGIDASYTSNIPIGAGLSSSAAVEVAFAALWQHTAGWVIDRLELALICQQAEVDYVGVNCGAMDQIASACGVEDHVLKIDLRSGEVEPILLPENITIVIADSSIRRILSDSGYNERRAACEEGVRILKKYYPGIESLRDVSQDDFHRHVNKFPKYPSPIRGYIGHVLREMERVEEGIRYLKTGEIKSFGLLMYTCHSSLKNFYQVSTAELDTLVDIAMTAPGYLGARLTGAGFGGCTVNLVESGKVDAFVDKLSTEYRGRTGLDAKIYACRASQGVTVSAG